MSLLLLLHCVSGLVGAGLNGVPGCLGTLVHSRAGFLGRLGGAVGYILTGVFGHIRGLVGGLLGAMRNVLARVLGDVGGFVGCLMGVLYQVLCADGGPNRKNGRNYRDSHCLHSLFSWARSHFAREILGSK